MIQDTRSGRGEKLLLIHGLGSSARGWDTIRSDLAAQREVIVIDLPGHGGVAAERDSGTFAGLVRSVEEYLTAAGLNGVDMVGSSMGGRIVLELARRGLAGDVVALDPGGFWRGWERNFFKATIGASGKLLRALRPALPTIASSSVGRTALLAQLSARPWALDGKMVATELQTFATTPTLDALVRDLGDGPEQTGPASDAGRITIGWGRQDRLCLPRQAERALAAFPSATLHWFDRCGHFPMWDQPAETVRLILRST